MSARCHPVKSSRVWNLWFLMHSVQPALQVHSTWAFVLKSLALDSTFFLPTLGFCPWLPARTSFSLDKKKSNKPGDLADYLWGSTELIKKVLKNLLNTEWVFFSLSLPAPPSSFFFSFSFGPANGTWLVFRQIIRKLSEEAYPERK